MTASPVDTTTDLHAVIAALRAERDALAETLAQRNSQYSERIDQQSATIDVLKAMSASPGDPQPVFELIVHRALELCNGASVGLFEFDGKLMYRRAASGGDEVVNQQFAAMFPMVPTRRLLGARAILDRQIVHVRDIDAEPDLFQAARPAAGKSLLAIPLLRDGEAIGALVLNSMEPGGFSDSQLELLKTFAEQAVIAINSAETYRALQTRTSDLQESLEYQTATSDVLAAISRSTGEVEPVLETLVETAARICEAEKAIIFRLHEGRYHVSASVGFSTEFKEYHAQHPTLPSRGTITGRVAVERKVVHIDDAATDPEYTARQSQFLGETRSMLGAPLLRGDEVLGVITFARSRVEPFTEKQIDLVRTFADQAVIAMENARLITEQREALEQQTATAELLQVINSSPGDLGPVFDAMLEKAMRLCEAAFGVLWTLDGDAYRATALRGVTPEFAQFVGSQRRRPEPDTALGQLASGESFVHVADVVRRRTTSAIARRLEELGSIRTLLAAPLRREQEVLGAFHIYRQEVRPFSDTQIALRSCAPGRGTPGAR